MEDLIVLNELLPEAPVLPEMLREPTSEMHPRSLPAAERRRGDASGEFMSVVCDTEKQVFHKSIAYSIDSTTWGRLRRRLGQVGRLVPAPVLYGLREWPFWTTCHHHRRLLQHYVGHDVCVFGVWLFERLVHGALSTCKALAELVP